jgi:DnaJ-class molecular chaperone
MTTLITAAIPLLIPGLLLTLGYLGTCVIFPFKACRHCQGHGQLHGWLGGIRFCPACDGTGLRLRAGRRLINAIRRTYRSYREINNTRNH